NILLSQLQFQTCYFTRRIEFTKVLVLPLDVQLNVLPPGPQIHLGRGQLAAGQRDVGRALAGEERNASLYAKVEVVALKLLKEVLEVVEFRKQAVFRKDIESRPFRPDLAFKTMLAGFSFELSLLEVQAARERAIDQVLLALLFVQRQHFRFDLDTPTRGETEP